MDEEIQNYFDFVLDLVKHCGKLMLEANDVVVSTKKVEWDVVTQYDQMIENILIKKIKEKFPTHKFICEEDCSNKSDLPPLTNAPTWIIDPIDGTANFIRNFPINGISIACVINKIETIGIVYNPFANELYTAVRGKGACLNGNPIHTSKVEDVIKSIFCCELSLAGREELRDIYFYRLKHLIGVNQGFRALGCAALSLCYVAKGTLDAYQADGLSPWDVAAGVIIVREAGGFVASSTGKQFDVMKPDLIATSSKNLGVKYLEIIQKGDNERLNK